MPRIVDHDARRRRVAEEAAELIAERGVDAVTFRELGERAGCSTAIVSHYFRDKRDVLRFTYAAAADRARQRLGVALSSGGERLQGGVEALLPLDPDSVRDWRVWFAFWGHAITDPDLAAEQRAHVRRTRAALASVIRELIEEGDVAADLDAEEEARRLLVRDHGHRGAGRLRPGRLAGRAPAGVRPWPPRRAGPSGRRIVGLACRPGHTAPASPDQGSARPRARRRHRLSSTPSDPDARAAASGRSGERHAREIPVDHPTDTQSAALSNVPRPTGAWVLMSDEMDAAASREGIQRITVAIGGASSHCAPP